MTEAQFARPFRSSFSPQQPAGLFARIGAAIHLIAEAFADALAMRREARRLYPHLSNDA